VHGVAKSREHSQIKVAGISQHRNPITLSLSAFRHVYILQQASEIWFGETV
jgi:hypothetical protein